MQYLQEDDRFYVPGAPGQANIAEIRFHRIGSDLSSIDETHVDINYRHEGIAEHLVALVVEQMRKEGRRIIPRCSYAKHEFERVSSYYDIWQHDDA